MPRVAPRDANEIDRLVMGTPKTSSARVRELLDLGMQQEALQMIDHMPYEEVAKLASLFKGAEEVVPALASENQAEAPAKPETTDVSETSEDTPPATPEPVEGEPTNLEGSKAANQKVAEEGCAEPSKEEPPKEEAPKEDAPVDESAPAMNELGEPTAEAEKAARLGYISGLQKAAHVILTRAAQRKAMVKQAAASPQAQLERLLDALL